MEEAIKKQINLFFCHFYNHTLKWNNIVEKTHKPISGLKNQAEQLCCIEMANVEEEFHEFPDLKLNLMAKIFAGIDDELFILRNIVKELNILMQELRSRRVAFEKSTLNIDWDDESAICGSALQPNLPNLLQMALLGWRTYNDLYQNISNIIKSLDVRSEKTLNQIKFTLSENDELKINEIVAITQYCYN